jgi:hypothetical protein
MAPTPALLWWQRRVETNWGVALILAVDLIAFTALLSPSHPHAPSGDNQPLVLSSAGEG